MARKDSGKIDLSEVFRRVQKEMLSQLSVGHLFEHGCSHGAATERNWLELFEWYLPQRYRAAPVFVIDCEGGRSRQIDLAIFDNFSSPRLFPHASGAHIPVESVYAVFEVKEMVSCTLLRNAGEKTASVRALKGASQNLIAGLLATGSAWKPEHFARNLGRTLSALPRPQRMDIGCCLKHGAFERRRTLKISNADESLIFFILSLLERLRTNGPARPTNLTRYAGNLRSFRV